MDAVTGSELALTEGAALLGAEEFVQLATMAAAVTTPLSRMAHPAKLLLRTRGESRFERERCQAGALSK